MVLGLLQTVAIDLVDFVFQKLLMMLRSVCRIRGPPCLNVSTVNPSSPGAFPDFALSREVLSSSIVKGVVVIGRSVLACGGRSVHGVLFGFLPSSFWKYFFHSVVSSSGRIVVPSVRFISPIDSLDVFFPGSWFTIAQVVCT